MGIIPLCTIAMTALFLGDLEKVTGRTYGGYGRHRDRGCHHYIAQIAAFPLKNRRAPECLSTLAQGGDLTESLKRFDSWFPGSKAFLLNWKSSNLQAITVDLLAVFTKSTMSILNGQGLQTGSPYMTAVMINLIVLMTLMIELSGRSIR